MFTENKTIYLKMPILGNSNVGKTTLLHLFKTKNMKRFTYKSNEFIFLENVRHGDYNFNIQIWDTLGLKTYKQIHKEIFQNASIAIVMYDVSDTSKRSYKDIKNWVKRLWAENGKGQIPVLIIGNKIDLRKANRPTLELEECKSIAMELYQESNLVIPIIEISAFSRENCYQLLDHLLDLVVDFYIRQNNPLNIPTE